MKAILLFALISVLIAAVVSDGGKWGERQEGDEKVYKRVHQKPYFLFQIVTEEVNLYFKGKTITQINVMDLQGKGNASIKKGGIGASEGLLFLQSGRNQNLHFLVEVYTKNKEAGI